MRTNIDLDDKLIKEAMKISDCHTKREVVNLALKELVKRLKRKGILKFMGSDCWEGNLEHIRGSRV